MRFLEPNAKLKTVRTTLYGDQAFTQWEMEILHTPVVQRLYDLKQLGFADRVFPDAVHSRFNHVLGVAEVAREAVANLIRWLEENENVVFAYWHEGADREIRGGELARMAQARREGVRLIALLHDLTHAAFGHTLEDEVQVFGQKHDEPERQQVFLDALVGQLLGAWIGECGLGSIGAEESDALVHLEVDRPLAIERARAIREADETAAKRLAVRLSELEFAGRALLHLSWAHGANEPGNLDGMLVTEVRKALDPGAAALEFVARRDIFLVDIVGNTICADLLDYARRDATNAGLKLGFDSRLLRYVCTVSVAGDYSPDSRACIRLATQFFTDKMRHDVLSEMSAILKARYLINERVLFHPAKCAAGATLGTAVQLLGLRDPPSWVQALGDQVFLALLGRVAQYLAAAAMSWSSGPGSKESLAAIIAKLLPVEPRLASLVNRCFESLIGDDAAPESARRILRNVEAARRLLWRLSARRRPQLVYRLRSSVRMGDSRTAPALAREYGDLGKRFDLERRVEDLCNLPLGTVVLHCPPERPGIKIARALVVGTDLSRARHLRQVAGDAHDLYHDELLPYQEEIAAVERMYSSIWQLHAFLDPDHDHKASLVRKVLEREVAVPNDTLLADPSVAAEPNRFDLVASEYWDHFGYVRLPDVVRELDAGVVRHRYGDAESEREAVLRAIERANGGAARQLDLIPDEG